MIENLDLLKELVMIDEQVMKEKINLEELLQYTKTPQLHYENSLILYDGNPNTTKKLVQSSIKNCLLYPSHSYLAINQFLVSDCNHLHLLLEVNDFKYREAQDVFDHVVVVDSKEMYEELKNVYKNLEYIEI